VEEEMTDILIWVGALAFATAVVWKALGGGKLRRYLRAALGRRNPPQPDNQSRAA
jgi:hypothetical protein